MTKSNDIKLSHPAALIATFFGVGKIPFAPGTFGSLATFPLVFLLNLSPNFTWFFILGMIAFVIIYITGYKASALYMDITKKHDPKEIVIDEVAGQLLTVILTIPFLFGYLNINFILFPVVILLDFLLFRVYDITKPWVVGWADKELDGAKSVMMDDIFAGIFASITIYTLFFILNLILSFSNVS